MAIGFRIVARERCVDASTVARFKDIPVANISDCMSRMSAGGPRLRPMHAGDKLTGAALTVKTRPGDNLLVHKALSMAAPGDVIVVDAGGDLTNAIIGELMAAMAIKRQIAGFVINGAIRDAGAIQLGHLPVYAAGVTHRGPYKDGPGEINVPISLDGMIVHPGDLICGDEDGVVCVPVDQAQILYQLAKAKHDAEQGMMTAIAQGRDDRSWVDAALVRLGCEIRS
ncbi:RraA family protein [Bordetella sp. FB-8]|uniref:RraA family protein n=1 Tax=Bordetella sp. FB-8 TaxID=1159870 RepID=UPI0003807A2B|nr:RraA family protein [Bordetella sp. FB-8]